jgi:predicted SAM-dependent methyltransferase
MMSENGAIYVQYGCGLSAPDGWLNFDISPTLRAQKLPVVGGLFRSMTKPVFPRNIRIGDIRRGLPLPPASAAGVYCSHVLEHLSLADCRVAIRNSFELLRPGGRFRLVMPDFRAYVDRYLAQGGPDAAPTFMHDTILGEERRPRGLGGLMRWWMGNAAHRWLWDYPSIEAELRRAGFTGIRRAEFHDSEDRRFDAVEQRERWEGQLGVECVKGPAKG